MRHSTISSRHQKHPTESTNLNYNIANPTSTNPTEMAADVIVNDVFTYRLISLVKGGVHTLTLRDTEDRSIVARTISKKGETYSTDFINDWVRRMVKDNA